MKTDYAKIDAAMDRLNSAWADVNRIASLRIGMISGGPSIDEEQSEAQTAFNALSALVEQALANGCREKRILEALRGNKFHSEMVREHFDAKRFDREWEKMNK